jgi:hypothetical protein
VTARWLVWLAGGLTVSCGTVGAPIAPENVGVAVTIEEQKRLDAARGQRPTSTVPVEAGDSDPALQGQDENLPPLRPVGGR